MFPTTREREDRDGREKGKTVIYKRPISQLLQTQQGPTLLYGVLKSP